MASKSIIEHELKMAKQIADYVNTRLNDFLKLEIINKDQLVQMSKIIIDENVEYNLKMRGMINCP